MAENHRIEIGRTYGNWTVICPGKTNRWHVKHWWCRCKCGTKKEVRESVLKVVDSEFCSDCKPMPKRIKHGLLSEPCYNVWRGIRQRCLNPKANGYKNYGGRGIKVCQRWNDFAAFCEDMSEGYKPGLDIERIDTNGNYEPGNCVWTTRKQNLRNRRNNRRMTFDGKTLCVSEWAEVTGISESAIRKRLRLKWPVAKILTTPSAAN